MKKIIAFFCVITNCVFLQANPLSDSIINNLCKSDYEYLKEKVGENKININFKKAWLLKAKKEGNLIEQINAYRQLMINEPNSKKKNYSDSIITVALKTNENNIIGSAFLNKGIVFYENKELVKALNYYLKAEDYLEKTKDLYTSNKTKYAIAQTKYYLGFYDEAIKIFNEVAVFFIEENDRAYLNTLHALGLCYQKINNFNKSKYYIDLGKNLSQEWNIKEMLKYFEHTQAINLYHQKKYNLCIEGLKKVIPKLNRENDFDNKTVAEFYIAKSYWQQKKYKDALPYLLKVDKTFLEKNYIRPDLRENYELLIKYYKQKEDTKLQLLYINRLLEVDELLNHNYKNLSQKIFKEYDAKKLINAKNEIENAMKWKNKVAYATSFFLLISTVVIISKHRRKSKYYKLKFDELMTSSNNSNSNSSKSLDVDLEINPEIVEMVLKNLEKFEKNTWKRI